MDINELINKKLDQRIAEKSLRELKTNFPQVDFVSNDYLGLARSEELFQLIEQKASALLPHRNGSAGSRLLAGNSVYAENVEQKLSTIFQAESSLLFNSGYVANLSVLSSVPQRGDTILYDELSHACIKDGARLSLAERHSFFHNDLDDLERKIKQSKGNVFIAVESIYSMDGDVCPLEELTTLAQRYGANIILDEAHSTGVMGNGGNGMAVSLKVHSKIFARIYTFGKAMGVHGACLAGSSSLIQYVINFARPFIYTTALPPHAIVSIACAFELLEKNDSLQKILRDKIARFKSQIKTTSHSAIQPIIIPGNDKVKSAASQLQRLGYDVRPVLSPTVKEGTERLRICLHTYNTDEEIAGLTNNLNMYL
jgi:8-amino-7-oxononanoate synthase